MYNRYKKFLFASLLLCSVMLVSCTGMSDGIVVNDKSSEIVLKSGSSELKISVRDNVPYIEYLKTGSSDNVIADDSAIAMPRYIKKDRQNIELKWVYKGIYSFDEQINGAETSMTTLIFKDESLNAVYRIYCACRKDIEGPFELSFDFANRSNSDMQVVPNKFFSCELRESEPVAWTFAKESGMAEGYRHYDGTHMSGKGIYKQKMTSGKGVSAWVSTFQNFNSSGYLPMIYMDNGDHGMYAALEWPAGRVDADALGQNVTINISMDNIGECGLFVTNVKSGDHLGLPSIYLGVYEGDVDDASNIFKSWFMACKTPSKFRNDNAEPLTQMDMQRGIDIEGWGVQSIKWDYGWWSNDTLGAWKSHEGSWQLRNPAYQSVLDSYSCADMAEFGELVKSRGFKWTVYLLLHDTLDANGDLTKEFGEFNSLSHPEWFSDRVIADGMGASADLGNAQCVEYLKKALLDFFKTNGITTWRSDFEPICYTSDKANRHASGGSDVMYWCSVGFRDIVNYLYANYSDFRYESCSSGGSMKDLFTATLATVINCDDSANYLSLRTTFYDSSYVIPPSQLQLPCNPDSFYTNTEYFNPAVKTDEDIHDAMIDMGMRSVILGVPMLGSWSGKGISKEYYTKYYNMYNDKIKVLVKNGNMYHILPRPDGVNWDGVMYCERENTESDIKGCVFLFKPSLEASSECCIKLRGLKKERDYSVVFEDRKEQNITASGEKLMTEGITVYIDGIGSDILWLY